ncbi:MAG: hypothetical protein RLO50_20835 [Azospirillaceae bacterium]
MLRIGPLRAATGIMAPVLLLAALAAVPGPSPAAVAEVRLGNVLVDCADLPLQIIRRLPPCDDYYSDLISRFRFDIDLGIDPLVELTNGMVFRCSELGVSARRVPECSAAPPPEGEAAPQ